MMSIRKVTISILAGRARQNMDSGIRSLFLEYNIQSRINS
jgi:hypothetical protein